MKKHVLIFFCLSVFSVHLFSQADNINPPANPVRLLFIHHSTGQNWLADDNGKLGIALKNNNYFVSDINYGWGLNTIGDRTDIGNWWEWFRGPNSATYMSAAYSEGGQNCSYTRLATNPAPTGTNHIIMFKSCFPNSALSGNPNEAVPAIGDNLLKGQSCSENHTVANAKGIYIDILEYFKVHQEKLFIVITAPPLTDATYSSNARTFNQWLCNDWLKTYPYKNVFVFDFYNVLTTNGGNANTNDLNSATGNHHRWYNNAVQHKTDVSSNIEAYPSGDDHPSEAGNLKATGEYLPLLNIAYNRWKSFADEVKNASHENIDAPVYSSPFTDKFMIDYNVNTKCNVSSNIFDITGRSTGLTVNSANVKGSHHVKFDTRSLKAGIYYCTIDADGYRSSFKIVKANE